MKKKTIICSLARKNMWPECSPAYQRYIRNKSGQTYEVKIISPPVKIFPNKPVEPGKRLTLKRIHDDETVYKIGNNYIRKITRKNNYEYIINDNYRLVTTNNMFGDELISLLFIY